MHSILNELYETRGHLKMTTKDSETGEILSFKDQNNQDFYLLKNEDYSSMDELKQSLKIFDLTYPNENDQKKSYTKLSNSEMINHLQFILSLCEENEFELLHLKLEWDRLFKQFENY